MSPHSGESITLSVGTPPDVHRRPRCVLLADVALRRVAPSSAVCKTSSLRNEGAQFRFLSNGIKTDSSSRTAASKCVLLSLKSGQNIRGEAGSLRSSIFSYQVDYRMKWVSSSWREVSEAKAQWFWSGIGLYVVTFFVLLSSDDFSKHIFNLWLNRNSKTWDTETDSNHSQHRSNVFVPKRLQRRKCFRRLSFLLLFVFVLFLTNEQKLVGWIWQHLRVDRRGNNSLLPWLPPQDHPFNNPRDAAAGGGDS